MMHTTTEHLASGSQACSSAGSSGLAQSASVLGLVQVCGKCVCSGVQADGVLVTWGMLISCRSSWQEPSQTLQAYSPYPPTLHGPSKPHGAKPNTKSSGTRVNMCWRIIQTITKWMMRSPRRAMWTVVKGKTVNQGQWSRISSHCSHSIHFMELFFSLTPSEILGTCFSVTIK